MSFQKRLNFGSAQETEIDAVRFEPLANGVRYTFVFGGMAKGVWRLAFGVRRSCSSSNPAARSDGVLECGSTAPSPFAPRVRGVGDAEGAVDRFAKVNADEERNVHHKHLPPLQGESSFGRVPGVKTPG